MLIAGVARQVRASAKAAAWRGVRQQIVAETSYERGDPTIGSQIIALKTSGANVFFLHANPRFSAQPDPTWEGLSRASTMR